MDDDSSLNLIQVDAAKTIQIYAVFYCVSIPQVKSFLAALILPIDAFFDKMVKQTEENNVMLGARLRKFRKLKDWTQKELGERAGVDWKNISSYESGRLAPSKRTVKLLAEAFEVPVSELLADEPTQPAVAIGDDPEMLRLFREATKLPESEQKHIKWMLSMALRQDRMQGVMAS